MRSGMTPSVIGGLGRLTHHHAVDVLPNFRGENIEDKKDITIFKFCNLANFAFRDASV